MPLARTHSVALVGVTGHVVEVEADIANGLVGTILIGLPDTALREARDRIRAAIVNSGEEWPQRKITVGLSPASLPKRGSWFDLAIAIGVLAAAGKVPRAAADGVMFFGELGLDGRLRPVHGVLPAVAAAVEAGFGKVMVAELNAAEAALVPGVRVIAASSLAGAADWLRGIPGRDGGPAAAELEGGQKLPGRRALNGPDSSTGGDGGASPAGHVQVAGQGTAMVPDLAELLGQSMARRAAEVCAAGGHHLSLLGPPGAGKTMLAERIPTILPRLDTAAALEVTAIHSVAGTLPPQVPLLTDPPFLAPHHTATKAAIIGGGSGIILPAPRRWRTGASCSSTRRRSSPRTCLTRYGSRSKRVRLWWPDWGSWRGSRPGSPWSWPRTHAHARRWPGRPRAVAAARPRAAGIWDGSRAHCSIASM